MTKAISAFSLPTEFNAFLYAPVREEERQHLPVLSALARLDLDPWAAAAELSKLPLDAAQVRLALLLSDLPEVDIPVADFGELVARLTKLLPFQQNSTAGIELRTESVRLRRLQRFAIESIMVMAVIWLTLNLLSLNGHNPRTAAPAAPQTVTLNPIR